MFCWSFPCPVRNGHVTVLFHICYNTDHKLPFPLCLAGCEQCQHHHCTCPCWQGNFYSLFGQTKSRIIWVCWALKRTNKSVDWAREAFSVLGFISSSWFECLLEMQDPTDQSGIDLFMVRELDGTQNEWGWPKAKVRVSVELAKPSTESIACMEIFIVICCLLLFASLRYLGYKKWCIQIVAWKCLCAHYCTVQWFCG